MNKETLKLKKRTVPKGSCAVDLISKILKENGQNVGFCLTRDSLLDTFLVPFTPKTLHYDRAGADEIIKLYYPASKESVVLLLNDTQDLFTLLSADTHKFKYEYPENVTELYIISTE